MGLTVETLKSFMHSTLLETFPDTTEVIDGRETTKANATLTSAVLVANQNYNTLVSDKPTRAIVRFDALSYQIKIALIFIYEYIMQDSALLHSLSLSSMSLSENQVFEHYLALRSAEQSEVDAMRKEFLEEVKDKEDDEKYHGIKLYHRYGTMANGRQLP